MNAQAEQMKGYVGELMGLVGGRNGNGVISNADFGFRNAELKKSDGNGKRPGGLPVRSTQKNKFFNEIANRTENIKEVPNINAQ